MYNQRIPLKPKMPGQPQVPKIEVPKLPEKVYCPVCGEKMTFLILTPQEVQGARAAGALQAAKLSSSCGVTAALTLRKTPEGLNIYSLTFWIIPGGANNILTPNEAMRWNINIGQNKHFSGGD